MAAIYLQKGTDADVNPELGYSILGVNLAVTQVTQDIVIQAEKDYLYYNKRFDTALNNGTITQAIYDIIIANQDTLRQLWEIESNLIIDKQILIDLVDNHQIPNVDTGGGTAAQIVEDIINEGYIIVKLN